jgi:hypothetical protein
MSTNPATPVAVSECEIMASVDESDAGEQLIIADVCSDDAYVSMSTEATVVVNDWR